MKLKDLKANQVPFYYQTYEGKVPEYDEDGYLTGEYVQKYSRPVQKFARISPNTTEVQFTPFGKDLVYDKMISTVQDLPINEFSKLYIDVVPVVNPDGTTDTEPDYEIVMAARDLNQKVWAIRKIEGYDSNKRESS